MTGIESAEAGVVVSPVTGRAHVLEGLPLKIYRASEAGYTTSEIKSHLKARQTDEAEIAAAFRQLRTRLLIDGDKTSYFSYGRRFALVSDVETFPSLSPALQANTEETGEVDEVLVLEHQRDAYQLYRNGMWAREEASADTMAIMLGGLIGRTLPNLMGYLAGSGDDETFLLVPADGALSRAQLFTLLTRYRFGGALYFDSNRLTTLRQLQISVSPEEADSLGLDISGGPARTTSRRLVTLPQSALPAPRSIVVAGPGAQQQQTGSKADLLARWLTQFPALSSPDLGNEMRTWIEDRNVYTVGVDAFLPTHQEGSSGKTNA